MSSPEQDDLGLSITSPEDATIAMDLPVPAYGNAIGPYRLIQPIGQGGMGEVWLAEQKEPVRRRVAVKLVKAGMDTREVVARFESERQALALMDHPAIAKVFDAGSTPDGRPYFAMEYVRGIPITAYCDKHRLTTPQRLELFVRVCEGVQHAHQKAVIHRDLKPSNILVSDVDGSPLPKIIDFGIAKATSQPLTAETMLTRLGAIVGTPGYMSPEQADSAGEDIDTRTDVYSLGVVLYELLVGTPPLDFRKVPLDQISRKLREEDAPRPSTKLRALGDDSKITAENRRTDRPTLAGQLRGDLDAIALKALEKDRSRRYGSPSDLAADIGRYLRNEPVLAVAPSVAYRARKFARRYRGALITAGAFALVLIAAAIVSIRQSIRANSEAAVSQAVSNFLQNDLLAQASSTTQSGLGGKPDPNLKVRTALDRAAVRIEGKFSRQPEVEAAIRDTIGRTYLDLGLYPEAGKQLERALDLHRRTLGAKNSTTLRTMSSLGRATELQGKYTEAEALLSQTLETMRRVLGPEHPDSVSAMYNLASIYNNEGKYREAEPLLRQTLEIRRRVLGPEHRATLASMNGLANAYNEQGKYQQAEPLYTQNLEISRRVLGPEHPNTLLAMSNLALNYDDEGKFKEAQALLLQTLEIRRRVLGPEHPDTLTTMQYLASAYSDQGNTAQADVVFSQILDIRRRVMGSEHPDTLLAMTNLAATYHSEGKYAQAEALGLQTLEIMRRVLGPEHPDTLWRMNNLANVYSSEGKYAQAEELFKRVLEARRRILGPEHPHTLTTIAEMASLYEREGKYAQAETSASEAVAGRRRALGKEDPDTLGAEADLAHIYLSEGKVAESESLAREAVEAERKVQPDDWVRFAVESLLGASLSGQKKYAEAEALLLEGYRGMQERKDRIEVPEQYHLNQAREWIVQLYQAWGKPEKAGEWKKK